MLVELQADNSHHGYKANKQMNKQKLCFSAYVGILLSSVRLVLSISVFYFYMMFPII